jgi:hypothetical protein
LTLSRRQRYSFQSKYDIICIKLYVIFIIASFLIKYNKFLFQCARHLPPKADKRKKRGGGEEERIIFQKRDRKKREFFVKSVWPFKHFFFYFVTARLTMDFKKIEKKNYYYYYICTWIGFESCVWKSLSLDHFTDFPRPSRGLI